MPESVIDPRKKPVHQKGCKIDMKPDENIINQAYKTDVYH